MYTLRYLPALALLALIACTHPAALKASKQNQARIGGVSLNQTMDQVSKVMGKPAESVSQRMLENGDREATWYYLTSYDDEINTAVTFRNGRVVEITQSPWLGNGNFQAAGK